MFGTVGLRCGQLNPALRWLLLCCLVASVASFSCPYPCPVPPRCFGVVDTSTCEYGVQPDTLGCNCGCTYCARGPDQQCGVVDGACGEGLACVGETLYDPGLCMFVAVTPEATEATTEAPTASTTASTTASSTTTQASSSSATTLSPGGTPSGSAPSPEGTTTQASPSPSATTLSPGGTPSGSAPSSEGTAVTTAAASPTEGCSQQATVPSAAVGDQDAGNCRRRKCSVSLCNDTKHRICSARGMEISRVEARGTCQDTSCRACFLQVSPAAISSCTSCGPNPLKRCLTTYYKCIRSHVLGTTLLLALDSPEAWAALQGKQPQRIVCHVPQVMET